MQPLLLAGHPAIDFLNTRFGPPQTAVETIGDGRSFVAWLGDAGILDPSLAAATIRRFRGQDLDAVAGEARTFREWASAWIERWREAPLAGYAAELRRLNRLLEREKVYRALAVTANGLRLVEHRRIERADALLAVVAVQFALLVATEQPALVKRCAGPGCTLWFLDRTKAHGRLFCSAAVCGNRAKVAAFRERHRTGSDGGAAARRRKPR